MGVLPANESSLADNKGTELLSLLIGLGKHIYERKIKLLHNLFLDNLLSLSAIESENSINKIDTTSNLLLDSGILKNNSESLEAFRTNGLFHKNRGESLRHRLHRSFSQPER